MEVIVNRQRWMDWVNLVLGVWLFVMPFFGYVPLSSSGAMNSYLFGSFLIVISVSAIVREQLWEEWLNFAIGIWLIAAPFTLGFTASGAFVTWNSIIIGLIIAADALLAALTARHESDGHHPSRA